MADLLSQPPGIEDIEFEIPISRESAGPTRFD